jgi:hypothetical protein
MTHPKNHCWMCHKKAVLFEVDGYGLLCADCYRATRWPDHGTDPQEFERGTDLDSFEAAQEAYQTGRPCQSWWPR